MKQLEELTQEIREKLPRLMELEKGVEIFVPKNYDLSEWFSYTIINISESNSYLDVRKPWEGEKLGEFTRVITVKNNAISYELERYALKDLRYYGKEPMLNDVLDWLSFTSKSESVIDFYGSIGEVVCDRGGFYITSLGKWDLSKIYLKDQSPELIKFLHSLINQ